MFPSSARCRRITGSGSPCLRPSPDATISNYSEAARRRFRTLRRCIAAFRAKSGAPTCIRSLRRSRVTLNSHIDFAGREAGNMRLFEATGVGAFLLTDFKDNLHTLFEPDREVAVWRSTDDCLAGIERALAMTGPRRYRARRPGPDDGAAYLSPSHPGDPGICRTSAGTAMKLPRIVRQIAEADHQGHADPAAPIPVLDRLSGARAAWTRQRAPQHRRADGWPRAPSPGRSAPIRA